MTVENLENNKLYIGVDIHRKTHKVTMKTNTDFGVAASVWKKSKPITIQNTIEDYTKLDSLIKRKTDKQTNVMIAVDHTGGHYSAPLVYYLVSRGYQVFYLDSKLVKLTKERVFGEENKNDKLDSIMITYLLYLNDYKGLSFRITKTSAEINSKSNLIRSLVLQRQQYVKVTTQITNRLHQYLLAVFPEAELNNFNALLKITIWYPTPRDMLKSNLQKITTISNKEKEEILFMAGKTVGIPANTYKWIIKDLSRERLKMITKSSVLAALLHREVKKHQYGTILLSFPFIGDIIAATLIGIIKDIKLWPNKKKLKKALGFYGREIVSGSSSPKRRPGKGGHSDGKRVIFQACLGCIKTSAPENDFRDYYHKQTRKNKMWIKAMSSTCGKMVEIIYHCLEHNETYKYQGIYKNINVE